MDLVYETVRRILRNTESVLAAVECVVVENSAANLDAHRILALVTHRDEWDLTEEGCIFVCKFSLASEDVQVHSMYPVYGDLSITMKQMRRNTIDLDTANPQQVLEQPPSGFTLTINPAQAQSDEDHLPSFYTHDIHSLSAFISECKRIKELSAIDASDTTTVAHTTAHFGWLRPYFSLRTYRSLLSQIPTDLRISNTPLIQRLSLASAGVPGVESADVQVIQDEWIKDNARADAEEGRRKISLRLGTFNVNGKLPSQDLSSWIQGLNTRPSDTSLPPIKKFSALTLDDFKQRSSEWYPNSTRDAEGIPNDDKESLPLDEDPDPDMFVIGFQELDLSTEALIYSTSTAREDAWCMAIFAALGEKAERYEKLTSKQLVGMLLVIIIKKSLKSQFGNVDTSYAGSGILGMMGNKGGTAIRVTLTPSLSTSEKEKDIEVPSTTQAQVDNDELKAPAEDIHVVQGINLTFVNTHLAAFDEMVDRRNEEFHELSRRLHFDRVTTTDTEQQIEMLTHEEPMELSIYESDVLFWMGDLNYRVDIPDLTLRQLLAEGEWTDKIATLIEYDQLKKAMTTGRAFHLFHEHTISYLPSYRFSPGLSTDQLGYDKKRKPAWTDRILYMNNTRCCEVTQHSYDSYPQITMSDHRPVAANFTIDFGLYNRSRYESEVERLYHNIDTLESFHGQPILKLHETFLDFGEIRYCVPIIKKLVIENTGKIPCVWRFIPVEIDTPICPEWLHIDKLTGMLPPNVKEEIIFTICVDRHTAPSINIGPRSLSGSLVLRTISGKDNFISIAGSYKPTCFSNKLTTLTRLPGSIRSLSSEKDLRPENQTLNAPREVMRLVNRLMENSPSVKDLFLVCPDEDMVNTICEYLDTGEEFPWTLSNLGKNKNENENEDEQETKILQAFATTLLRLLDSLVEPVIPSELHTRCVNVSSRDEAFEVLGELQSASVNVWITVTAFLHFICQSSGNYNYTQHIADIFTPVLMREERNTTKIPVSPIAKRQFLLFFIDQVQ